jgi:hypothetical protein
VNLTTSTLLRRVSRRGFSLAGAHSPPAAYYTLSLCVGISRKNKQVKTFNNGSLGSGIDEERSEMR